MNAFEKFEICKTIKRYKKIVSTQAAVKKLAKKGFDEGIVVISQRQTKGYGRMGRTWNSNIGGLWFSMLLKPLMLPDEASKLTLLLSVALSKILEKNYKVSSQIKWPNDILVCGKKIAGFILEMSSEHSITHWVVAGVGVNINNKLPENLKDVAISLKDILGVKINKVEFMVAFLTEFENLYFSFQKDGFKQFLKEYNDKIAYKGDLIEIDDGYGVITGKNLGIDDTGRLIVKTAGGFKRITSGTVRKGRRQ